MGIFIKPKHGILRELIRRSLVHFELNIIIQIIWEEMHSVYHEDNFYTRRTHLIEAARVTIDKEYDDLKERYG